MTLARLAKGPRIEAARALALAVAGLSLLLIRPAFLGGPAPGPLLALTYLVLGAASWGAAIPARDEGFLVPWAALTVGLVAVAAAALAAGPPLPVPRGGFTPALAGLAAVAEEAFFRRFLYGWLARWGAAAAVGGTALAFALIHVPAYGAGAFWVDLGAGLLLSWQRWSTGGWAVPAATHLWANLLAVLG